MLHSLCITQGVADSTKAPTHALTSTKAYLLQANEFEPDKQLLLLAQHLHIQHSRAEEGPEEESWSSCLAPAQVLDVI